MKRDHWPQTDQCITKAWFLLLGLDMEEESLPSGHLTATLSCFPLSEESILTNFQVCFFLFPSCIYILGSETDMTLFSKITLDF